MIVDFENIDILKEREGDNLGDGKFSGIPKMGISLIPKRREGDNLGDGKFSGIPKMGISGIGKFEDGDILGMMTSRGIFETLNFTTRRKTHNLKNRISRNEPKPAFSLYLCSLSILLLFLRG